MMNGIGGAGAASDEIVAQIERNAAVSSYEMWQSILDAARQWKSPGFDAAQIELRHYYEGNFGPHLAAAVAARYPNTGHRMPAAPYNWALLYAQNGASVFDLPPGFYLKGEDGERVSAKDDDSAADYATMIEEAALQVQLAEADRRTTLAGDCFIRAHSDALEGFAVDKPAKTKATLFWPNDILVIPHPRAPDNLACALAIIASVACDDGVAGGTGTETYEVWRRAYEDKPGNVTVFSFWTCELVTVHSKKAYRDNREQVDRSVTSSYIWEHYPHRRAPWVVIRSGIASGKPFVDPNRNLVPLFDSINGSVMSKLFAVDMGAASVLVRKTDQPAPSKIALGAGLMVNIALKDELISVPQSTDFAGINLSIANALAMVAVTSRQPIGGFSVDSKAAPQSGVALRIEREPQMKARLEAIARVVPPVIELLSIMAEIHDHQRQTKILANGARPWCEPQDPPEYEELQTTQTRAFQLFDAGKITGEQLLVMCRVAPDEETAAALLEVLKQRALEEKKEAIPIDEQGDPLPANPDDVDLGDQEPDEAEEPTMPGAKKKAPPFPPKKP